MNKIFLIGLLFCLITPGLALGMVAGFTPDDIANARIEGIKLNSAISSAVKQKSVEPIHQVRKEWMVWNGKNGAFIYTQFSTLAEAFSRVSDLTSAEIEVAVKSRQGKLAFEVELASDYIPKVKSLNLQLNLNNKTLKPAFQRAEIANTPQLGLYIVRLTGLFEAGELKGDEKVDLQVLESGGTEPLLRFKFDLTQVR